MSERPSQTGYWEEELHVGETPLSARDALVVSNVRHGAHWYVRLQVHRTETVDGTPRRVPGQRGVILPVAALGPVADLLQRAVERLPTEPAETDDESWFADPTEP